jgi:DcmR-like sensory protein
MAGRASWGEGSLADSAVWRDVLEAPDPGRHIVQFYRHPDAMGDAVSAWAAHSLHRGGGAVLIGTSDHLRLLRARLAHAGLDVATLESSGRLAALEAEGVMARFFVRDKPDPARFDLLARRLVASVRDSLADPRAGIRAWGEMVDLLRQRDNVPAALRLERMWNDLIAAEDLRLLCSYSVDALDAIAQDNLFLDLAASHSRLLPEEDEPRVEAAVAQAMREVFGAEDTSALRATLAARKPMPAGTPPGSAVLAGLMHVAPQLGQRVVARVRRYALEQPAA